MCAPAHAAPWARCPCSPALPCAALQGDFQVAASPVSPFNKEPWTILRIPVPTFRCRAVHRRHFYPTAWCSGARQTVTQAHPGPPHTSSGARRGLAGVPSMPCRRVSLITPPPRPGALVGGSVGCRRSSPTPRRPYAHPSLSARVFAVRGRGQNAGQRERHFHGINNTHLGVMGTAPFARRYQSSVSETNKTPRAEVTQGRSMAEIQMCDQNMGKFLPY